MSNRPKARKPKARKEQEEYMVSDGLAHLIALFPDAQVNENGTKVIVENRVGE
jgi:hypothetical protein